MCVCVLKMPLLSIRQDLFHYAAPVPEKRSGCLVWSWYDDVHKGQPRDLPDASQQHESETIDSCHNESRKTLFSLRQYIRMMRHTNLPVILCFLLPFPMKRVNHTRRPQQIQENGTFMISGMGHSKQCVVWEVRVTTHPSIVRFQDPRVLGSDKRSKLPRWILKHRVDSKCNLSMEEPLQVWI